MGANDLPPSLRFNPDVRQAITIFIRLALGGSALVISTGHDSHVSVDPDPEVR